MSLIVQDLTKRYGDKVVVDHLSFRMDQPGVYALLGSNGAGKTTSIRMMLGILARPPAQHGHLQRRLSRRGARTLSEI